jgi:hypothetical protein
VRYVAEVVVDTQAGLHRGESFARLVHAEQFGNRVAQCRRAVPSSPSPDASSTSSVLRDEREF